MDPITFSMTRDLVQAFHQLPADGRKRVHQYLCATALAAWLGFATEHQPMTYCDSVVGLVHDLDFELPGEACNAAFDESSGLDVAAIKQRYLEPMAALQDGDVEWPDETQYAYYAIYNAFRKYAVDDPIDDWLIVNQALSARPKCEDLQAVLQAAIMQAAIMQAAIMQAVSPALNGINS